MPYNLNDISKYFTHGETITLDGVSGQLMSERNSVLTLSVEGSEKKVDLSNVKLIKEFEEKKRRWEQNLEKLIKAGAVKVEPEEWSSLTPDRGQALVEVKTAPAGFLSKYFMFGPVEFSHVTTHLGQSIALEFRVDDESRKAFQRLKAVYDPQSKWGCYKPNRVATAEIVSVYLLGAVKGASTKSEDTSTQSPASESTTAIPVMDAKQTFQVPYQITNQPDGSLPDMQGFGLERVGSAEGGWYSLCPIKADRALAQGETISACLVHRRTGELTRIDYTAKAGKLGAKQWLEDFAKQVVEAGKPITAGGLSDSNAFSSSHEEPRLWCQADYRAFSTAPFDSNLVQVLACGDDFPLALGQTLSLQVRDLKTQALHEQHMFTAKADSGWAKALCEQVNRDSRLLRAGVKGANCTVAPGEVNNAFWGPQCAELCVTLTEVNWWASRMLDGTKEVPNDGVLRAWVYDTFSQRLLGHHAWTPSSTQRAGGKWLEAWAAALATSAVAPYLRVDTTTAMLEQRGDGLRIFARLPGDDYDAEGPLLASAFKAPEDAVLVTVRHPGKQALLHHALFKPQECADLPGNEQSWLQALASFIETQQWPELYVKDGRQLWLSRHAELMVALDNVGDGSEWASGDYRRELLSADEWPDEVAADPVAFTVEPGEGLTGVTISSLGAELAFRLDPAARDKGYRVTACVPRQAAAKQLREAYINYVDIAIAYEKPVVVTFAEIDTFAAIQKLVLSSGIEKSDGGVFQTAYGGWLNSAASAVAEPTAAAYAAAFTAFTADVAGAVKADAAADTAFHAAAVAAAELTATFISIAEFHGYVLPAAKAVSDAASAAMLEVYEWAVAKLAYAIAVAQTAGTAVWPVSVTGDTVTWQGPLTNQAYDLYLDCPESERGNEALTVGHIGALGSTQFWHDVKPVNFTPPKALKQHNEISFLCEDYGYTHRSELFDTGGHGEAGVDPRMGLFHAHYPVASLQGLQGQGPAVDLTLHYSALRANEAGLGDGWAWRFSSMHVREKLLTLADGAQVEFTDEQWTKLGKGEAIKLASCVVRSKKDYSEFTLDLPSGRQEVLKKPAAEGSDEEEPNKTFRDQILKTLVAIKGKSQPDFPTEPENWQQWVTVIFSSTVYSGAAKWDYDEAIAKWHTDQNIIKLNKLIDQYKQPFVLLVPSTIESPYGEKLTLEWKRQKGQFLLLAVKSGVEALFTAEYITPQEKSAQVNMQVWPQSKSERYDVELVLKDYLLRTIKRIELRAQDGVEDNRHVLQQVDCDYDDDPTLDRVLCGLRELDGSRECVKYQAWLPKDEAEKTGRPGLPRVALHTLVPGDGQESQVATYRYDGDFLMTDQRVVSVEYERGAHGAREQHLLVHGNVTHSGSVNRFELLRAVASEQGHWLDFCTRQNEQDDDQYRETKGYRYTGAGDEFVELLHALETGANGSKINVKDGAVLVQHQRDLLKWISRKSDKADRPKLAACITRLLASYTSSERDALGRTVEVATHIEDIAGNELLRRKSDELTVYRCYYDKAGQNPFTVVFDNSAQPAQPAQPAQLKSVEGLAALPILSCPDIPKHASAPVMAEYQCDPFGNPQGLRLFGYREVTYGGRKRLEQAEVLTVEGVKGAVKGNLLDSTAGWEMADASAKLLWRQRSTTATLPTREGSKDSKVMTWSVEDNQVSHEIIDKAESVFKLSHRQEFVDNPNNGGIVVRLKTTTKAGSQELSKELRSRHGRRLLEQVKQGEEVHWQYDSLGRVTQQTRYALKKDNKGLYKNKDKDQKPDEQTVTTYSDDGKLATHTHANKDISRSYLDGVQRVWRREWRKNGNQHFVPLEQYSLQGLDTSQLLASCEWDYLPGGQAVVVMTPAPLAVGPQAWVREQGGLDRSGMRSLLQAQTDEAAVNAEGATQDILSQRIIEEGLDEQRLYQRTIDYTYRQNGTFEQVEHLIDSTGQAQLQVCQRFDSSGDIIGYDRTLGTQTRSYALERDALGRVTKITRPDNTVVEYSYHGLSNHATQLTVDGKVVAKQEVQNDSTLTSRTVGSRAYSFTNDTVTLPDRTTKLAALRGAEGQSVKANEQTLCSFTENNGSQTLASPASDATMKRGWEQVQGSGDLPGRQGVTQTSPRAKRQGHRWLSLRGRPLASLRADGHWQRVFTDEQGRVLRTCQDHEEVVHRYDALGRLQSRQAQALKVGGQWWVLSEHDGFGQEVTRRFLHNGNECFKQCMTWLGDGRLASKTSHENGEQVRVERFTYDVLDRLQRYDCEASAAKHCPQDAQGTAVKAQEFTWDALSNLTRCITTAFDGKTQTEDLAYGTASDPTRLTEITCGEDKRPLAWNTNGYLTDAAGQHRFSYNGAGQLDKVHDSKGNVLARYEYDGSQRLAAQYLKADGSTRELRYDGDELIGEIHYDKDDKVSRTTSLSSGLAQYDGNEVRWLIDDPQVGVAGQVKDGALKLAPLLPFGEGTALEGLVIGYNGMRRDPLTGHYHAGNGYRSYDPALRRYAQPDWLSPFGEGGLNDYAHCPDPVNLHDPSGAIMLSRWGQNNQLETYDKALQDTVKMPIGGRWRGLAFSLTVALIGIALSVVTAGQSLMLAAFIIAMSVASFAFELTALLTEDSHPEVSRWLSTASVVTGVLSCLGFVGVFKAGLKTLVFLGKGARLIGKGTKAVWSGAKNLWRTGFRGATRVRPLSRTAIRVGGPRGYAWAGGWGNSATSGGARNIIWTGGSPGASAVGGLRGPGASAVGGLRGAGKQVWGYLNGTVTAAETSSTTFTRWGWFGKIGNFFTESIHTEGASRGLSYAIHYLNTALEANVLKGTIETSQSLAEKQQQSVSVRGGGTHEALAVPKLPSLRIVEHSLPATNSLRFW